MRSLPESQLLTNRKPPEESVAAPVLLTVDEVAARLRISRTKVYELIQSGALSAYRLPAIRIANQDLEQFLANCRTEPRQDHPTWQRLKPVKLKHLR
jgi:excisionase family DNA binding protein